MTGEYFTSPDYLPIRSLAANSKNGVVQVPAFLQGEVGITVANHVAG